MEFPEKKLILLSAFLLLFSACGVMGQSNALKKELVSMTQGVTAIIYNRGSEINSCDYCTLQHIDRVLKKKLHLPIYMVNQSNITFKDSTISFRHHAREGRNLNSITNSTLCNLLDSFSDGKYFIWWSDSLYQYSDSVVSNIRGREAKVEFRTDKTLVDSLELPSELEITNTSNFSTSLSKRADVIFFNNSINGVVSVYEIKSKKCIHVNFDSICMQNVDFLYSKFYEEMPGFVEKTQLLSREVFGGSLAELGKSGFFEPKEARSFRGDVFIYGTGQMLYPSSDSTYHILFSDVILKLNKSSRISLFINKYEEHLDENRQLFLPKTLGVSRRNQVDLTSYGPQKVGLEYKEISTLSTFILSDSLLDLIEKSTIYYPEYLRQRHDPEFLYNKKYFRQSRDSSLVGLRLLIYKGDSLLLHPYIPYLYSMIDSTKVYNLPLIYHQFINPYESNTPNFNTQFNVVNVFEDKGRFVMNTIETGSLATFITKDLKKYKLIKIHHEGRRNMKFIGFRKGRLLFTAQPLGSDTVFLYSMTID